MQTACNAGDRIRGWDIGRDIRFFTGGRWGSSGRAESLFSRNERYRRSLLTAGGMPPSISPSSKVYVHPLRFGICARSATILPIRSGFRSSESLFSRLGEYDPPFFGQALSSLQ